MLIDRIAIWSQNCSAEKEYSKKKMNLKLLHTLIREKRSYKSVDAIITQELIFTF